ncbi:hypothetical protein FIM25_02615 [Desulfobotulus mexicanus]|uniref:Uncharacterized protein n=1 Tax=Desulfobotulus mexicanus TaxID=2586642 RepID=A0A5Q4VHS4_9BACT|nr:hypothetical protein FIM25_02615 [Desulfobotulus mexicanus]
MGNGPWACGVLEKLGTLANRKKNGKSALTKIIYHGAKKVLQDLVRFATRMRHRQGIFPWK